MLHRFTQGIRRFWTRSIQRQLMLGIAVVHAVLMTIFVVDLVERQRHFLTEQSIAQANSLAKTLAANSSSWLLARDLEGLNEVLQSQTGYPQLRYAMVLTPQGRVVAHTEPDKAGLYLVDEISRSLLESAVETHLLIADRQLVDTAHPVITSSKLIGWARVGISQEEISTGLMALTRNGVLYTLLAIIVGSLFALLMARGLTHGLQRLVVVADGIREGRRDLRSTTERDDEIGRLGDNLNQMLDALERREQDLNKALTEVENLATRDPLTRLPNRLLLMDRLNHAILASQREGQTLALLMIDLDHFKNINDSLGHHVGDLLIKQVGVRMSGCVRSSDTLARLGGDEFVVMYSNVEDGGVGHLAQRITEILRKPYRIEGHELNSSCSVGISIYPDDANDAEALLRNADTAMYHAKEVGRNTYKYFSSYMNQRAKNRLELENELRNALARDQLLVVYQPQVGITDNKVVGAEALLRWRHPTKGIILPADFIPVAEDTGMITDIGAWVLNEACAQQLRWRRQGLPSLRMAVNLSVRQVNRDLVNVVSQALDKTGLDPACLDLEITESLLMQDVEQSTKILGEVGASGVTISMDDFGTGFSSLSVLKLFPVQTIKIDKSFVRDVVDDQDDAAIVRSVVAMAHSMGLRVIAEGVEIQEQLRYLRKLGCDEYQGYLFSEPVEAAAFAAWFESR